MPKNLRLFAILTLTHKSIHCMGKIWHWLNARRGKKAAVTLSQKRIDRHFGKRVKSQHYICADAIISWRRSYLRARLSKRSPDRIGRADIVFGCTCPMQKRPQMIHSDHSPQVASTSIFGEYLTVSEYRSAS